MTSSLRERRRQRTAATIRAAAVRLAWTHGLENITTEMISEAAGISARTFFNYFPFREAALAPPDLDFPADSVEKFVNGSGQLADDLMDLFDPIFAALGDNRETWRQSYILAQTAPKLLALNNSVYVKFDTAVCDMLAQRMGKDHKSAETVHLAALIAATVRVGLAIWVESGQGTAQSNVRARLESMSGVISQL